jgi:hypothetical protein
MAKVFYCDPTTPHGRGSLVGYRLRRRLSWLPTTLAQLPELVRGFVHGWREGSP